MIIVFGPLWFVIAVLAIVYLIGDDKQFDALVNCLVVCIGSMVALAIIAVVGILIFNATPYGKRVNAERESREAQEWGDRVRQERDRITGKTQEERIREAKLAYYGSNWEEQEAAKQMTKEMIKEAFAGPVKPQEVFDPVTKTWHRPETFAAIMKFRERN
jgi:hypothetical protein